MVYNIEKLFDIDTERKVLFKKKILDEKDKTFEVGCGPWIDEFNILFNLIKMKIDLVIQDMK